MRASRLGTVIAAVALGPAAVAAAADVQVRQLDWLGADGEVLIPASRVVDLELSFDPTDPEDQLLLDGAFVNVVSEDGQWLVQNLPLFAQDPEELAGIRPSVMLGLPQDNGVPVELLVLGVTLTPEPLPGPPEPILQPVEVFPSPYLVGGRLGGGSNLSTIPFTLGPWVGPLLPQPEGGGFVDPDITIRPVSEDSMGCAPGGAARSIQYLGDRNGFETDSAQEIYDDLVDDMNTDVGDGGTSDPDNLEGKDEYVDENNLPIDTRQVLDGLGSIRDVANALEGGGDVEILIDWEGDGGHVATVTGVVKWPDGSVTISYVDDPTQGDGVAENRQHVIHVRPDGTFDGGTVDGFQIQTLDDCPEDLDGDGSVGFSDLLTVLSAFGDCPGPGSCEPDFDGDGEVDFDDLLQLVSRFGPCLF